MMYSIENNKVNNTTFLANCVWMLLRKIFGEWCNFVLFRLSEFF